MNMKALLAGAAVTTVLCASEASAATITLGSGWQFDQANALNSTTAHSPWKFSVPTGAEYTFSLTDGQTPGDVYSVTINGLVTVPTTFTLYPTTFVNNLGPAAANFASAWTDKDFSHLQLTLAAGDYSIVIRNISGPERFPAGVGVRVDAIPEASTWAMLILGFAGLGFAGYGARRQAVSIA